MQLASRRNWLQPILTCFIILVCISAIGLLQVPQLHRLQQQSQTASVAEIQQEVDAEAIRLTLLRNTPTFGFDNLIADWTFLSFLQYFGDEPARQKTGYRLSPDYFEVVLKRDPYFLQAYTFLSTSGSLYAALPERSTQIMKQALASLKPNVPAGAYVAWRELAIDQLLFLGDAQAAQQSFEMAAAWARQSSISGSDQIAVDSQQTASFLAQNPNSKTAQVAAWAMVLSNVADDRTRKTAVDRIEALGGNIIPNPDGTVKIQLPSKD